MKSEVIEFPHAGHFIGSHECVFRRCTYVNGFIVSTVGEYLPGNAKKIQPVGSSPNELYETMIFKAKKNDKDACPVCVYVPADWTELKCQRYSNSVDAIAGHNKLIELLKQKGTGAKHLTNKSWGIQTGHKS